MGIYRRPDSPFWWLWLERPGQRAIRESTNIPVDGGTPGATRQNRELAEQAYAARMGDLARQHYQLPTERPRVSFTQYRTWYLEHVSQHKRGAEREASMFRQLGRFFDDRRLDEITKDLALEWRTSRRQEVGPATVNREQELLVHVLNTAVPRYLEANPLKGLGRLRTRTVDVRILTHAEERRLLKVLDAQDRALIICALDTLARLSDVVNLQRPQDHRTYISFLDPKVDAYKVPVSKRLRKALAGLPKDGPWYFPKHHTNRTGARAPQTSAIRMFEKACEAARIPLRRKKGGVSFHVLRHTGASRMLAAGVDVKTVAEIGGWKDLAVMNRYLHPTDRAKQLAVDAIGRSG